ASDSSARGPPYTGSTGPRTPDSPAGFGRPSSAPPLPATDTPTPWSDAESLLPGDPRFDHRLEHFRSSPPSDVPSSPLLAGPTSRNCCRKEEPTFRSSRSCPPFTTPRPSLPLYFLRCALSAPRKLRQTLILDQRCTAPSSLRSCNELQT